MNSSICTAAMANIVISQQSPNLISNALRHSCVRLGVAVTEISALQTWNGCRDFYWASLMMLNLTWPTPLWSDSTDHLNILELRNWALRILEKNMIHIQELPGNGLSERTVTSFHWSHHLESTHSSSWHQQSQLFCLVHPKKTQIKSWNHQMRPCLISIAEKKQICEKKNIPGSIIFELPVTSKW